MIVSKTPLRISFFSGGSDTPTFYKREDGAALSVTIDKFIHVIVRKTPNLPIKTMFDIVDESDNIEDMKHIISRESLKLFNIDSEITIASLSDIFSNGSGLGSSSAFTVGLVNSLFKLNDIGASKELIAKFACDIEMDKCGYPVGKQDQYAASYGGFNLLKFYNNQTVDVKKIKSENLSKLNDNLLLVHSGKGRIGNDFLQKQSVAMMDDVKFNKVRQNRDLAFEGLNYILSDDLDSFGDLLHQSWINKRQIVSDITEDYLDNIYNIAKESGAIGGKILGAGGGGFFVFYVKEDKRECVINSLKNKTNCKIFPFRFYDEGTKIMSYE
jgi:D-glycero-alpha-D-manno-heptose-7-phosphate kinase